MDVTIHIADEIARQIVPEGADPALVARVALEALVLEGYRSRALGESAVRRMLGFESRLDVHAFLKQHGVYLQYGIAELEQDMAAAREVVAEIEAERGAGKVR
jgi:hypothetical protein